MWISEKLAQRRTAGDNLAAEVTGICREGIQAQGSNEYREVPIVAPQGLSYAPQIGKKCVLVPLNGSVVSTGTYMEDKFLEDGEIMLYSGTGSVTLKNDGRVLINGDVYINGQKY